MILVPLNFIQASENALAYAIEFAKRFDTLEIVCFHATESTHTSSEELDSIRTKLNEKIEQIKADAPTVVKLHIVAGDYEENIEKFSRQNLIDIIIVGTRKVSGLSKVMHEGRTAKFLNNTSLPTLVIPEDYTFKPIVNIMWASDFKPIKNDDALDPLVAIARVFDAEVKIAHVHTKRDNLDMYEANEMHRQDFVFSDKVRHSFKKIMRSSISKGIAYYLKLKGNNDILVLMKRKSGFMDGLFRKEQSIEFGVNPDQPILFLHEDADKFSLKRDYDV